VNAGDDKKSIAVLPFVNMSENAQNDYFSDGLSEELLNVLAKVPGLHVAARTSSFYFKGATASVSDIGRQLGVATILEGSVRRAGNRVRITAQLINAKDGFHLWSETYDRELNDIFAIQDNIAGEVVGALKIKLLGADAGASPALRKPTTNLEAHDAYLLGQQKMARRTSASLTEAARSFQKAIDLDPNYALAYVGLADALSCLTDYSTLPQGEMLAKAERWRVRRLSSTAGSGKRTPRWVLSLSIEATWPRRSPPTRRRSSSAPTTPWRTCGTASSYRASTRRRLSRCSKKRWSWTRCRRRSTPTWGGP
jgi:TolB-like protein